MEVVILWILRDTFSNMKAMLEFNILTEKCWNPLESCGDTLPNSKLADHDLSKSKVVVNVLSILRHSFIHLCLRSK